MKTTENLITYSEGFNPLEYLTPEKMERLDKLRNKEFYLRDTGITPRLFNQWRQNGLIDFADKREWVKLTFANFLWLKIIDDLRAFGVSLEDIRKVKSVCLQDAFEIIGENTSEEQFDKLVIEIIKKGKRLPAVEIEKLEKYLIENNVSVLKFIKQESGIAFSLLEAMTLNILMSGSDAYLTLFLSNHLAPNETSNEKVLVKLRHKRKSITEVFFYSNEFKKMTIPVNPEILFEIPHIKLPLKSYIYEFIAEPKNENKVESLQLLSKNELLLLKEMRKGTVSKITIHYSKGDIDRIDVTRPLVKAQETRLFETFMKGDFANIEYTVEAGRIVKFQKTTKIRPNKT